MDSDVLRLVRAVRTLELGRRMHPIGHGLERELCVRLGVGPERLRRVVARANAERVLVAPGREGPTGERRMHSFHLSAKGWGLAGILAA